MLEYFGEKREEARIEGWGGGGEVGEDSQDVGGVPPTRCFKEAGGRVVVFKKGLDGGAGARVVGLMFMIWGGGVHDDRTLRANESYVSRVSHQIREDSHLQEKMTPFEPSTSLVFRDG